MLMWCLFNSAQALTAAASKIPYIQLEFIFAEVFD